MMGIKKYLLIEDLTSAHLARHRPEQTKAKVYGLSEYFNHHYMQKEWWKAKHQYDTALTIAVFMDFPEEDMIRLFGSRPYASDDDDLTEGIFPEQKVLKAQHECIKLGQTRENELSRSPTGQKISG